MNIRGYVAINPEVGCEVHLARHKRSTRYVVAKRYPMQWYKSLELGVTIMSRINHVNVLQFDVWTTTEREAALWMIVELASGGSLARAIRHDEGLRPRTVHHVATQVLSAMAHLHSSGIVCGDMRPVGIVYDSVGTIKLSNFTLACAVCEKGRRGSAMPPNYRMPGHYFPPEIFDGAPFSFYSDMWGLGCLLYEMTCGVPLFDEALPLDELRLRVCSQPLSFSKRFSRSAPLELQHLVRSLLRKNPLDRLFWPFLAMHPWIRGALPVGQVPTQVVWDTVFMKWWEDFVADDPSGGRIFSERSEMFTESQLAMTSSDSGSGADGSTLRGTSTILGADGPHSQLELQENVVQLVDEEGDDNVGCVSDEDTDDMGRDGVGNKNGVVDEHETGLRKGVDGGTRPATREGAPSRGAVDVHDDEVTAVTSKDPNRAQGQSGQLRPATTGGAVKKASDDGDSHSGIYSDRGGKVKQRPETVPAYPEGHVDVMDYDAAYAEYVANSEQKVVARQLFMVSSLGIDPTSKGGASHGHGDNMSLLAQDDSQSGDEERSKRLDERVGYDDLDDGSEGTDRSINDQQVTSTVKGAIDAVHAPSGAAPSGSASFSSTPDVAHVDKAVSASASDTASSEDMGLAGRNQLPTVEFHNVEENSSAEGPAPAVNDVLASVEDGSSSGFVSDVATSREEEVGKPDDVKRVGSPLKDDTSQGNRSSAGASRTVDDMRNILKNVTQASATSGRSDMGSTGELGRSAGMNGSTISAVDDGRSEESDEGSASIEGRSVSSVSLSSVEDEAARQERKRLRARRERGASVDRHSDDHDDSDVSEEALADSYVESLALTGPLPDRRDSIELVPVQRLGQPNAWSTDDALGRVQNLPTDSESDSAWSVNSPAATTSGAERHWTFLDCRFLRHISDELSVDAYVAAMSMSMDGLFTEDGKGTSGAGQRMKGGDQSREVSNRGGSSWYASSAAAEDSARCNKSPRLQGHASTIVEGVCAINWPFGSSSRGPIWCRDGYVAETGEYVCIRWQEYPKYPQLGGGVGVCPLLGRQAFFHAAHERRNAVLERVRRVVTGVAAVRQKMDALKYLHYLLALRPCVVFVLRHSRLVTTLLGLLCRAVKLVIGEKQKKMSVWFTKRIREQMERTGSPMSDRKVFKAGGGSKTMAAKSLTEDLLSVICHVVANPLRCFAAVNDDRYETVVAECERVCAACLAVVLTCDKNALAREAASGAVCVFAWALGCASLDNVSPPTGPERVIMRFWDQRLKAIPNFVSEDFLTLVGAVLAPFQPRKLRRLRQKKQGCMANSLVVHDLRALRNVLQCLSRFCMNVPCVIVHIMTKHPRLVEIVLTIAVYHLRGYLSDFAEQEEAMQLQLQQEADADGGSDDTGESGTRSRRRRGSAGTDGGMQQGMERVVQNRDRLHQRRVYARVELVRTICMSAFGLVVRLLVRLNKLTVTARFMDMVLTPIGGPGAAATSDKLVQDDERHSTGKFGSTGGASGLNSSAAASSFAGAGGLGQQWQDPWNILERLPVLDRDAEGSGPRYLLPALCTSSVEGLRNVGLMMCTSLFFLPFGYAEVSQRADTDFVMVDGDRDYGAPPVFSPSVCASIRGRGMAFTRKQYVELTSGHHGKLIRVALLQALCSTDLVHEKGRGLSDSFGRRREGRSGERRGRDHVPLMDSRRESLRGMPQPPLPNGVVWDSVDNVTLRQREPEGQARAIACLGFLAALDPIGAALSIGGVDLTSDDEQIASASGSSTNSKQAGGGNMKDSRNTDVISGPGLAVRGVGTSIAWDNAGGRTTADGMDSKGGDDGGSDTDIDEESEGQVMARKKLERERDMWLTVFARMVDLLEVVQAGMAGQVRMQDADEEHERRLYVGHLKFCADALEFGVLGIRTFVMRILGMVCMRLEDSALSVTSLAATLGTVYSGQHDLLDVLARLEPFRDVVSLSTLFRAVSAVVSVNNLVPFVIDGDKGGLGRLRGVVNDRIMNMAMYGTDSDDHMGGAEASDGWLNVYAAIENSQALQDALTSRDPLELVVACLARVCDMETLVYLAAYRHLHAADEGDDVSELGGDDVADGRGCANRPRGDRALAAGQRGGIEASKSGSAARGTTKQQVSRVIMKLRGIITACLDVLSAVAISPGVLGRTDPAHAVFCMLPTLQRLVSVLIARRFVARAIEGAQQQRDVHSQDDRNNLSVRQVTSPDQAHGLEACVTAFAVFSRLLVVYIGDPAFFAPPSLGSGNQGDERDNDDDGACDSGDGRSDQADHTSSCARGARTKAYGGRNSALARTRSPDGFRKNRSEMMSQTLEKLVDDAMALVVTFMRCSFQPVRCVTLELLHHVMLMDPSWCVDFLCRKRSVVWCPFMTLPASNRDVQWDLARGVMYGRHVACIPVMSGGSGQGMRVEVDVDILPLLLNMFSPPGDEQDSVSGSPSGGGGAGEDGSDDDDNDDLYRTDASMVYDRTFAISCALVGRVLMSSGVCVSTVVTSTTIVRDCVKWLGLLAARTKQHPVSFEAGRGSGERFKYADSALDVRGLRVDDAEHTVTGVHPLCAGYDSAFFRTDQPASRNDGENALSAGSAGRQGAAGTLNAAQDGQASRAMRLLRVMALNNGGGGVQSDRSVSIMDSFASAWVAQSSDDMLLMVQCTLEMMGYMMWSVQCKLDEGMQSQPAGGVPPNEGKSGGGSRIAAPVMDYARQVAPFCTVADAISNVIAPLITSQCLPVGLLAAHVLTLAAQLFCNVDLKAVAAVSQLEDSGPHRGFDGEEIPFTPPLYRVSMIPQSLASLMESLWCNANTVRRLALMVSPTAWVCLPVRIYDPQVQSDVWSQYDMVDAERDGETSGDGKRRGSAVAHDEGVEALVVYWAELRSMCCRIARRVVRSLWRCLACAADIVVYYRAQSPLGEAAGRVLRMHGRVAQGSRRLQKQLEDKYRRTRRGRGGADMEGGSGGGMVQQCDVVSDVLALGIDGGLLPEPVPLLQPPHAVWPRLGGSKQLGEACVEHRREWLLYAPFAALSQALAQLQLLNLLDERRPTEARLAERVIQFGASGDGSRRGSASGNAAGASAPR